MTRLLTKLLGRLPIGWLQLTHSRSRMVAAVAGVAFANVLVFVQLGILGALSNTVRLSYQPVSADVLISSNDANTLTDGSPISRRYMWQALTVEGVQAAAPLYLGKTDLNLANGATPSIAVYALPPEASLFEGRLLKEPRVNNHPANGKLASLAIPRTALIDTRTRNIDPLITQQISKQQPYDIEINGKRLTLINGFRLGGGLSNDGAMITSESTFLEMYPQRSSATPSHILLKLNDNKQMAKVLTRLKDKFNEEPLIIQNFEDAISDDTAYQTRERPVGIVFGLGVFIGLIVGLVIVYQVLSTDVADHIKEYATLKAMGYPHLFFLGVVLEEAIILALLGFIPGFIISSTVYFIINTVAGLPAEMTTMRALCVFSGTIVACTISGALATRRLKSADPAELF